MSKYISLRNSNIIDEIYHRQNEADVERQKEFLAARRIQAWWRGVQTRQYIIFLHKSSCVVQAAYRAFKGRNQYQKVIQEAVDKMRNGYYAKMATRIQSRWRGYFTRKYKHNYYARKDYLQAVLKRNAEVRDALSEYLETQQEQKELENRRFEEQEKTLQARRYHYMRSTYQINGVFASPWFPQTDFEKLLSSVKPLSQLEREKLFPVKKNDVENQKLPPLKLTPQAKRMQGPFRDPREVHDQRFRALSPSLRVSTAYDSLEQQLKKERDMEWTKRIQNKPMYFPERRTGDKTEHKPLLHTMSKYGEIPYGTKYFREESAEAKQMPKFKSVVPSIPIFDKAGKTFGKGTVY